MAFFNRTKRIGQRGFLARVLCDRSGNVFAMTAAAVFPMIGVVGGAIDASRMYMVRSRLQAACDSGVLAGRKAMVTNVYDANAQARADAMFSFNFQNADYQTVNTTFVDSSDGNGRVSATATTSIPMTLMKVFGFSTQSASVACSADVQIPNIDIVFVLDVTGSMGDEIKGTEKIVSLRAAAKRFYRSLQTQLQANGANAGQIRYGFVPYSQTVNGKDLFKSSPDNSKGELSTSHLVSVANVESRVANFVASSTEGEWVDDPTTNPTSFDQRYDHAQNNSIRPYVATNTSGTVMSNLDCNYYAENRSFEINSNPTRRVYLHPQTSWPGDQGMGSSTLYSTSTNPGSGTVTSTKPSSGAFYWEITFDRISGTWEDNNGAKTGNYKTCVRRVTWNKFVWSPDYKFKNWTYRSVPYDVSAALNGGSISYARPRIWDSQNGEWKDDRRDFDDYDAPGPGEYTPVELAATPDASKFNVETFSWNGCLEERDTVAVDNFTPIPSNAWDLNVIAGGTNGQTRWRPILDRLTYNRGRTSDLTTTSTLAPANHSCPTARMRNLNVMSQTAFDTYIDSLEPTGYTYLDVGMVWGLRLIASQGMFASRNLTGPNGGQISRHIIFLTDGEPVSVDTTNSAYGIEVVSKRITGNTGSSMASLHAKRFQALCDSQRGSVAIWAIAFGTSVTGNLSNCADPGRAYQADDSSDLDDAFASIARDIADLRLVQ